MGSDIKQDIYSFLEELEKKYGAIPKMAHNLFNSNERVHYSGPFFDKNELSAAIEAFLFSLWHSSGDYCSNFENEFSKQTNDKYGCFVNSGSSANLILITALKDFYKWNDGDEIIVSPCGFPTTVSPIIQNNLTPIFIDIDFNDLNFNLNILETKITLLTKAIFLSPVLGSPPDINKLLEICKKHNLKLILDCCDSLWTKFNDKYLTEYTIASTHSFYPAHTITTLEGGMITSNNKKIISICKQLSTWARGCFCSSSENFSLNGACQKRFSDWLKIGTIVDHRYVFERLGYNLKNLELCAAIGLEQLKKKDIIIQKRKENLVKIQNIIKESEIDVIFSQIHPLVDWVPFAVPIICKNKEYKQKLVQKLEKNNIQTRNYFAGNLLLHPAFKKYGNSNNYPESNKVLDLVFFIGCAPHLTDDNLKKIEKILKEFRNE